MRKRIIAALCGLAMSLTFLPVAGIGVAAAGIEPIVIGFTDENMAALEAAGGTVAPNENAQGVVVKGEVSQDGDNAAFKGSHIAGTDYNATANGIRFTPGAPLPVGTRYKISVWFYVPEKGNKDVAGKAALIGPSILLNGAAGNNEFKTPTTEGGAGTVTYDTWMNLVFETVAFSEPITTVDFRFYTNAEPTHPEVWYIDNIEITSLEEQVVEIQDIVPLKDAYKDYFMMGTAGGASALTGTRFELIQKHFDTFTYENEMKPENVQRVEGTFTFQTVDQMTQILKDNGFNIIGHTTAWHSQSPSWLWSDPAKARERLEKHIEAVITNSGKDLTAIDVVNEAFSDSAQDGAWQDQLRTEGWFSALGADFIEIAFRKADEVRKAIGRPDLKLYYNDYNLDGPGKSTAVYNMVKELREKGVPIDGIGMQSHFNQSTSPKNVRRSLELFGSIPGIEISVTEMDITIQSSLGNAGLNETEDKQQAAQYAQLFSLYREYAAGPANPDAAKRLITRVTLWGTTDNASWRGDRFPLLFDKNYQAKGAYYAAIDPDKYMTENDITDLTADVEAPKAVSVRGTPVLDGEMEEIWNTTQEIVVDRPVNNGPVGATAKIRTLWDDQFLYVYAIVTDPVLAEEASASHEQDSIEVFLSEKNHKEVAYEDGDGQYRVSFSNRQTYNARKKDGFESATKLIDGGYVVEMQVKFYATTPAEGQVVGFDVQVNDATGATRTALAIWSDLTGSGYQNASTWGDLTLLNELPPEPSPTPEATPAPTPEVSPSAPAASDEPDNSGNGLSTGAIIGIIAGGVLLIGLVVVILVTRRKKAK